MIKSNIKLQYGDKRKGLKTPRYLHLEISERAFNRFGAKYTVEHFAIIDEETGAKTLIDTSYKALTQEEYSQLSLAVTAYIVANEINTTGMTVWEIEELRNSIGLLIFVQTDWMKDEDGNSLGYLCYESQPTNWELI